MIETPILIILKHAELLQTFVPMLCLNFVSQQFVVILID